jgi:hypothetical protein
MERTRKEPAMQSDTRQDPARAAGLDLLPAAIVACGAPGEPAPRLLALQSAIAKAVQMLAAFRLSGLHVPRPAWPRLRATEQTRGEPT